MLDVVRGRPAAGVQVELLRHSPDTGGPETVTRTRTNSDGRTDEPLLSAGELTSGTYELVFDVGAYFEEHGLADNGPPFLGLVPVRFGIGNGSGFQTG